jgi:hypothetical protein
MKEFRHAKNSPDVEWDQDTGDGTTNGQRADRALTAVRAWAAAEMDNVELSTQIADLLVDMMHLCRREGIDFDKGLFNARMHHSEERKGGFATEDNRSPMLGSN